jgi:sarcosine oxidase
MPQVDHVIVGAGINGLCTAFWLRQRGAGRIVVCDRFGPGHDRGSSHGATRITRSSYDDPRFVAMAQVAHAECWPQLERAVGGSLRTPTPGLFFGPVDGPFAAYARATLGSGAAVEAIDVMTARRRFPLLRLHDGDGALLDHTAAVVLAAATMQGLAAWLSAADVALRWHEPVAAVRPVAGGVEVATATTTWHAHSAVLALGPWTGSLAAADATGGPLVVQPQEVGYFAGDGLDGDAVAPGRFPVWARIGRTAEDFHYGLPAVDGSGVKLAVHRTTGEGVDPDAPLPAIAEAGLLELARERFAVAAPRLRWTERCLYTMARDHDLRVARAAEAPVVTIAACSGHAFKFGPLLGRMAADLALAR